MLTVAIIISFIIYIRTNGDVIKEIIIDYLSTFLKTEVIFFCLRAVGK